MRKSKENLIAKYLPTVPRILAPQEVGHIVSNTFGITAAPEMRPEGFEFETGVGKVKCHDGEEVTFFTFMPDRDKMLGKKYRVVMIEIDDWSHNKV